jgi:serine protease inhibitor
MTISPTVNTFVSSLSVYIALDMLVNSAEATALTIVDVEVSAGGEDEPVVEVIDFNLNRPFIISIVERSTGSILFLGKKDKIN